MVEELPPSQEESPQVDNLQNQGRRNTCDIMRPCMNASNLSNDSTIDQISKESHLEVLKE